MSSRVRARRAPAVWASVLLVTIAGAGAGCRSATDARQANESVGAVSGLSFVLEPSVVSVGQGATAQAIGTIRGASGLVTSAVDGVPNGVSLRVTSATVTDSLTTEKYIFFADGAARPGTYALTVRVMRTGRPDVHAPLTLKVVGP